MASVCSNHRVACPGAGAGAGAGAFAASRGLGLVGRSAATEMASGGAQGALTYALDPLIGSKSWSGFAGYTVSGVVSGAVQGGAASKTNLLLNQRLGGYVAPGQVAWHLPATAAVSGVAGVATVKVPDLMPSGGRRDFMAARVTEFVSGGINETVTAADETTSQEFADKGLQESAKGLASNPSDLKKLLKP